MRSIGIDIIEIDRIRRVVENSGDRFLLRVYTEKERSYCRLPDGTYRYSSLAARFAAKEAFYKAAFPLVRHAISWQACEVETDADGVPRLKIADELMRELGTSVYHLSLSHSRNHAIAIVLIE